MRQTRDKVGKRIRYADQSGELAAFGVFSKDSDGRFETGEILGWASTKWPGRFTGLPVVHNAPLVEAISLGNSASADVVPNDLLACQQALIAAQAEIKNLLALQLKSLVLIEKLQPIAEKYEALRRRKKASARLPRSTG